MWKYIIITLSVVFLAVGGVFFLWTLAEQDNWHKINIPWYENVQASKTTYQQVWADLLESADIPESHVEHLSSEQKTDFWQTIDSFWQRQLETMSEEYLEERTWGLSEKEKSKYIVEKFLSRSYLSSEEVWQMSEEEFEIVIDEMNEEWKQTKEYLKEQEEKQQQEWITQDERMLEALADNEPSPYIQKKEEIMEITDNRCEDAASFGTLWRCLAGSNMENVQDLKQVLSEWEYEEFEYSYYLEQYVSSPAEIFEEVQTDVQKDAIMDALEELYEMWRLRSWHCSNIKNWQAKSKCEDFF